MQALTCGFTAVEETYADSPISVPTRAWHHVAVTYDGETVRFYMSGFFLGSIALSNTGANKEYDLTIGGTYGDETYYMAIQRISR